jgi:large subunit ribosomal protein L10
VADFEALRKKLRSEHGTITVAKRNLLLLALKNKGYTVESQALPGAVAVAAGDDEVTPAKVVATFRKDHEQVELYGGILEQTFMDAAQVKQLATLPGKPELLGKIVGSMNAPIAGFVNVLAGNLRGLVTVLSAIKDKKPA